MNEIEIGEYVRFKDGEIGKVIDIKENPLRVVYSQYGEIELVSEIAKHSKNIIDLIENKDLLQIKADNNEIITIGIDENTVDLKYDEIIEHINNKEYELLSILTHEQYENNCYKVVE